MAKAVIRAGLCSTKVTTIINVASDMLPSLIKSEMVSLVDTKSLSAHNMFGEVG